MRVLVACECSGIVRDAFIRKGHEAYSCDLEPSEIDGPHYQTDVKNVLGQWHWDLIIAHPPCTYLTVAAARWLYDERYPNRKKDMEEAAKFFMMFFDWADKVAVENPIGRMSTLYKKPNQIIQPYQFGHDATKATCLWLKNLPELKPTKIVEPTYVTTKTGKRFSKWYWETSCLPHKDRAKERSRTFTGIAEAMAEQWS